ncbi:internal scaffolding protein [robinz microvirus RP_107]|nr:internal scaffolding protein [robinz microvirus RP_107]
MAKLSFYRPHARVQWDGSVVNPVTGEVTYPPSLTKQEFQAECDINNIVKQYSTTGMMRHVSARAAQGMYTDLPDGIDFQESLHTVEEGRKAFMSLPSKTRSRFSNDPAEFLAFLSNPQNEAEARELGLLNPKPVAASGNGTTPPPEEPLKS